MNTLLTTFFLIISGSLCSQIVDDFSDGNFTSSPIWSGTQTDYIVNSSGELQLNNSVAATSYLSLPNALSSSGNVEWRLKTRQTFSPSASNFARVYLTATSSDLTSDPDGFYLQLGESGSADAVRLYKSISGVAVELLSGPAGQVASSFSLGIKVLRDSIGHWELFLDDSGGTNFLSVGAVLDTSALLGTYSGIYQSYTISNATKFYYDDIYIGDQIIDVSPPNVVSAAAPSLSQIDLLFDESLDQLSAENLSNYSISPYLSISSAYLDTINPSLVHLNVIPLMSNGQSYQIETSSIFDLAMNVSGIQHIALICLIAETPILGDVVLNEFLCDPTPSLGLPESEFVEIYNRSSKIFNVNQWKLADASSSGTLDQAWLFPGNYMVLCPNSKIDSFAFSNGVLNFPSFNNFGDNIVLRSSSGLQLDSISYTKDWYGSSEKASGGYSIERINPNDPCTNVLDWGASNDISGGTPGGVNSLYDASQDSVPPKFDQLLVLDPNVLEVYFNEGMDSLTLATVSVSIEPQLIVANQYVLTPFPTQMTLVFSEEIKPSQNYILTLDHAADCWLNATSLSGVFALPEGAIEGDVVINEILFNPITGGSDWIEVYNNSSKLIDLHGWSFANFENDTISHQQDIEDHFLLYPQSYAVISEDTAHILQQFSAAIPGSFVQSNLPSYSNDNGTVYLISNGAVIDVVGYSEDWHFELLDDNEGKSLERIDPNGESGHSSNWHTAAEPIGFGTPGAKNSQYLSTLETGNFFFTSETLSPDNDGYEDVLQINYEFTAPGFVGAFTVYDDRGRKIASVIQSELLGVDGSFTWDGITDDGTKASVGTYIGVFEAFNIEGGEVVLRRKAFVVAGKL